MTCKSVQGKLSAYIDGELSGFEMLDIRSHVHRCPNCAGEMEQFRQLKWAVGNMAESDPGPDLADMLKEAVLKSENAAQRRVPIAAMSTLAFAAALLISLSALRSHDDHEAIPAKSAPTASRTNFDMDRDQAYQSGGDYFNDGTFIITASAPASRR